MKEIEKNYEEDGFYYPAAPVGETIVVVSSISMIMLFVIPLSLYLSSLLNMTPN